MSAAASSTRAAFSVQTSGRKRPVASAKPAMMPVASAVGRAADGENRAGGADGHDHVADPGAETERGGGVVAGAGAEHGAGRGAERWPSRPVAASPAGSAGPSTRGTAGSRPQARRSRSGR